MNDLSVFEKGLVSVYTTDEGNKVVNARELHDFLDVGTRFNDWIKRQLGDYGFEEDLDFYSFLSKKGKGRPSKEYLLTLDTGKELGMVEKNDQGRKIRRYFIEVDKRATGKKPSKVGEMIVADKVEGVNKLTEGLLKLGQSFGMSEQSSRVYAVKEAKKYTEINLNPLLENNVVEDQLYTVTELGSKSDLSAIKFNRILRDLGYQYKSSKKWKATDKGQSHSDVVAVEGNGTRMYLKWYETILEQEDVTQAIQEETQG